MWRRILDSLPWESSKLCCTQTTVSSLGCVIPRWCVFVLYVQTNLCLCVTFLILPAELQHQLFFFSPHLSLFPLSLYLSLFLCCSHSFPLCGMCSFVQLELDCLFPGGERVMVLLSSHS